MQNNNIQLPELNSKIPFFDIFCQIEKEYNLKFYFVGGFVRDLLLGKVSADIDIVPFKMDYDKVSRIIKYRLKCTAIAFKDNVRLVKNDVVIDVSKPRGNDINEDISKRDFTINNLAVDTCGVIYGNCEDINNKIINSVYEENFDDDPLRMLRAFRFISQLGFDLEKRTKEKIILKKSMIANVAVERIFDEIRKLITGDFFSKAFNSMIQTEFIFEILPEMKHLTGIGKSKYHFQDVFNHTVDATLNMFKFTKSLNLNKEKTLILMTAILLHDLGKADKCYVGKDNFINHENISANLADKVLDRLNYPKKIKEKIIHLIKNHNKIRIYASNNAKDITLLKFIYQNFSLLDEHILISLSDNLSKNTDMTLLYRTIKRIRHLKESIDFEKTKIFNGKDLLNLGVKAGPNMKIILDDVHFRLAVNYLTNKNEVIKYIENNYKELL